MVLNAQYITNKMSPYLMKLPEMKVHTVIRNRGIVSELSLCQTVNSLRPFTECSTCLAMSFFFFFFCPQDDSRNLISSKQRL